VVGESKDGFINTTFWRKDQCLQANEDRLDIVVGFAKNKTREDRGKVQKRHSVSADAILVVESGLLVNLRMFEEAQNRLNME
jgi:hypothetical protein